jgi:hypothetical protein
VSDRPTKQTTIPPLPPDTRIEKLARAVCVAWGTDPDKRVFWGDDDTFNCPAYLTKRAQDQAKAFLAMTEAARDF